MRRILIVDDEEHTRLLCRRFLTRVGGFEVREAATGEDALAILASTSFDCVLSDYRMGAVSGIDVLAEALARQPSAVRALMSGFADDAVIACAMARARIHEFIEKPLTSHEFEGTLRRVIVEKHCPPPGPRPGG